MTKLLRVQAPAFCAGVEVHHNLGRVSWGKMAPYLRRIIGGMTVAEFKQFLDGIGKRNGWEYSWL